MFIAPQPRLSRKDTIALMQNGAKIENMVEKVATFLSKVLVLKNEEVHPYKSFVHISREEIHHLPTRQRLEEMREIDELYKFVGHFEDLASRIRDYCLLNRGCNMDISVYANEGPYYDDDEVIEEGLRTTRVHVGGIYLRLMRDVAHSALWWLGELDKVLCAAADIERTEAVTGLLEKTRQVLATAISKRVALENKESVINDQLSSRALDGMIADEIRRTRPVAEEVINTELQGLAMIDCIARTPSSTESQRILTQELPLLSHMVCSPPCELTKSTHFMGMKLDQLGRALAEDLDIEVRVALASFWADSHRDDACLAIAAACKEMREWNPVAASSFPGIVRATAKTNTANTEIPDMPFRHAPRRYISKGATSRRTGLDEEGLRAVRLIQCIWELAGQGFFQPGIAATKIVMPVAMDGILFGRMGAAMIEKERRTNNKGVMLGNMIGGLYDMESDNKHEIDKALCSLSSFSCAELETVFSTSGKILSIVCGTLSKKTRERMLVSVPDDYKSFATDALAITLPLLERYRNRVGIDFTMRTHPLVDMLRTVPKAREWSPLQGILRLALEDLRGAHSNVRDALDKLHDAHTLVARKGDSQSSKRKVVYEFDSWTLKCLYDSWVMNVEQ